MSADKEIPCHLIRSLPCATRLLPRYRNSASSVFRGYFLCNKPYFSYPASRPTLPSLPRTAPPKLRSITEFSITFLFFSIVGGICYRYLLISVSRVGKALWIQCASGEVIEICWGLICEYSNLRAYLNICFEFEIFGIILRTFKCLWYYLWTFEYLSILRISTVDLVRTTMTIYSSLRFQISPYQLKYSLV